MTDFAVAAGHELTAGAAADVLRAGGTAVDAAIAGALGAMVAEPVLAGLLGGGFLMVREPDGKAHLLDFFVQTPHRRSPESELDFRAIAAQFGTVTQEFHIGAGTIAVPGVAPGLAEAHRRFGRIPFRELAGPAVAVARAGVTVTEFQARLSSIVAEILRSDPAVQALFCIRDAPLVAGSTWRNPDLADTLDPYAHEGPRFVTEGEVAAALLTVARAGGHLQAEDIRVYRPEWREPLTWSRGTARVRLNPPPSLGGALIAFALGMAHADPGPVALVQAFETTSRARVETALDAAPEDAALRLLDPTLVARYRNGIAGRPASTRGTTHISVIDRDGMGAALTLSNGEGCGRIAPGTGMMPNNMLGEADLLPRGFQSWHPDRRLSSMMAPTTVDWPEGRMAMLGSGGSNRIRTAVAQVLIGLIDRDEHLAAAIGRPRLHVEPGDPPAVDFEDPGGGAMRDAILRDYAQARPWPDHSMFFGGVHAVLRTASGDLAAAGDPRRAGAALTG